MSRVKLRLFLWSVTVAFALLAILSTAALLGDVAHIARAGRIDLWDRLAPFALPALACLFCWGFASVSWVAVVSDWNEQRLPAALRGKPLTLVAILCFFTFGLVLMGLDLLDGDVTLRRLGHVTTDKRPASFALVTGVYVIGCVGVLAGWYAAVKTWVRPLTTPFKPPLEDPERTRSI